jgi:hypothetical protein
MMHHQPRTRRLAIVLFCAAPAALLAQAERITIRLAPKPDQIVHYRTSTDMDMEMTGLKAPDGAPPPPAMHMDMKMGMASTQVINHPDEQGRFDSQFTLDEMTMDMTMNGQKMPLPSTAGNPLIGRTMTATYDAHGAVVNMTVPPDMEAMSAPLKQMLEAMYKTVPVAATIGVGETTTLPYVVSLPVPGRPLGLSGQVRIHLVAIEQEGPDRVARFDQTIDMTMDAQAPVDPNAPGAAPAPTFKMSGGGTLEWNLDRGFVKASDMKTTIEGQILGAQMHGTMRATMAGTY